MPKFSTENDYQKIIETPHTIKTVYTYQNNTNLLLECNKYKVSIIVRQRINTKYSKKCIGTANNKTLSEVKALFRAHIDSTTTANENFPPSSSVTLSDYFYKEYVPSASTYKRSIDQDKRFMDKHILPLLGMKPLKEIRKADIQNLIKHFASKNHKPNTQKRYIQCLSAVITHAVAADIIASNPVHQVKKPRSSQNIRKVISFEQFKTMLTAAREYDNSLIGCLIVSAIRTGARLSELKNARWDEIDFDTKTWHFPITKANKPRTISIPSDLISELQRLKEERSDTVFVFQSPKRQAPISKPHNKWKQFLRDSNLPDIRFHDIRHCFATYALEKANCTLIELRDHLGHSSVAITQMYTKASHAITAEKISQFML